MTVEQTTGPSGLRERKKQLTRHALVRAALELFTTRGYERTTVDEIAEAVEVSQRTFFRYFAGKEDAALAVQQVVAAHFTATLRERPPAESPFEAMRNALLISWETIGDTIEEIVPIELHMRSYLMIESTPALLAVHLRRALELEDEVTEIIAGREGLDAGTDPRPRVAVAAFGGVTRVAGRQWGLGGDWSVPALRRQLADHLDQLGPALTREWRGGAGDAGR
ncbi:TetR family transcriptional regulator [Streptomyces sp. CAU 1734]|uniref:TetR family transcriptional regulator n=1 Tax=Streptomyces sp. CAU 1734 TaxID=3140360 RepID=UPI0032606D5F